VLLAESVTVTVKLNCPAVVGVPPKLPLEENDRPGGVLPEIEKVYGEVPPVAEKLAP
jgi:hypothetical protein